MKIALISNPTSRRQKPDFPPIGIAYLGAMAHREGHEVLLIDGGLQTIPQITAATRKFSPDFIGVTCWTIGRDMVWKLCAALNKYLPDVNLVIGGPHASIYPEHIFKKTHASAVVLGEGEQTFVEMVTALDAKKDLSTIAGLVLKHNDGQLFYTPPRPPIDNLSTIPFPYYENFHKFSFTKYVGFPWLPGPTAAVISSRGCVFDCAYCGSVSFWGRNWRARSVENVLSEIELLIEKFGIQSFFFYDDNFPVDKSRAIAICEGIQKKNWNLKWSCCSHVKMVNRELLKAMKASGCISIDFGLESGSSKILNNINKRQTPEEIEEVFALVHEAGIATRAYLIVGCPGEDQSTIDETIDLIGRVQPMSLGANILWLLPGTQVYQNAVENGFINEDQWLDFDDIPFNLQEHSMPELEALRTRLLKGIARKKGGYLPMITYHLKDLYYKYPRLSIFRSMVPKQFR